MTQHETARSRQLVWRRNGLGATMIVCALSAAGCHPIENFDLLKTSLPPHNPHQFEAPVNYGYFPTLWRPWPGAEAGPGQSMTRQPESEEIPRSETTNETLPEPGNETPGDNVAPPGMENVFDLPADNPPADMDQGGAGGRGEAPAEMPDTTLPDDLIPPEAEKGAPADAPAKPEAPAEQETIPDQLIPDDTAAPPPGATTHHPHLDLDTLPEDAPAGSLIPEPEPVVARPARPGLIMPDDKDPRSPSRVRKPIENALRPSSKHGAKAALESPDHALRELSRGKSLRGASPIKEVAFEGPQLNMPIAKDNAPALITASDEVSVPADESGPRSEAPVTVKGNDWVAAREVQQRTRSASTAPGKSDSATWRPLGTRRTANDSLAKSPALPTEQPLPQVSRPKYPAVQTAHAEPEANVESVRKESAAKRTGNPLR